MTKLLSIVIAATFAAASLSVSVQAADKKPTAEQCKKDPKMKGCEEMKKK